MTEDELLELDELRRRAYGPDADIAGDPAAMSRLMELEAAVRREREGPALRTSSLPVARSHLDEGDGDVGRPVPVPGALEADAEAEADPDPPRPEVGHRRSWWIAATLGATSILVVAAVALWPRVAATPPAASASPSPSASAVAEVTCGSGWGASAAGRLRPPSEDDLVWSPLWDPVRIRGPTVVLFTGHGQWLGQVTPVFVPGGVASVVQVLAPREARIVTFGSSREGGGSITSPDYPDSEAMVAAARRIVPLPPCPYPDTYPLLIVAPGDTCVELEVTLAGGPVYRATVAIGDGVCPRS